MNKWLVVATAGAAVIVCVAIVAGKDDIGRFLRMRNM